MSDHQNFIILRFVVRPDFAMHPGEPALWRFSAVPDTTTENAVGTLGRLRSLRKYNSKSPSGDRVEYRACLLTELTDEQLKALAGE